MSKKIAIVSLGCAKNLVHSENMMGVLQARGYTIIEEYDQADVIIVNTCGFINSAKEESIGAILELANYKQEKCQVLIAMGCMVQKYAKELAEGLPEVDIFLGTGSYLEIADILDKHYHDQTQYIEVAQEWKDEKTERIPRILTTPNHYAYLRISEGCDNHCTYCVIPQMQGPHRSRSIETLVQEATELAELGVRELILVGQDTSYYGKDLYGKFSLDILLKELAKIPQIHWIRILYAYPNNFTDELIDTIAQEEKVCNYLDIPLQHGDNRILRKMNRQITVEEIEALIAKLRAKIPNIVLRSTFITGFPSESEEEYENLLTFLERNGLQRVGAFPYSQEEGTPAAMMSNQIPQEVAERRAEELMELQYDIMYRYHQSMIGKELLVTVDEISEDVENLLLCRSYGEAPDVDPYILVYNDEIHDIGDYFYVKIVDIDEYDMIGEFINEYEFAE